MTDFVKVIATILAALTTAVEGERAKWEAQLKQNIEDGDEAVNAFKFGMAQQSELREAAEATVERLTKALTGSLVAMKIAAALPMVAAEYDFGPAIGEALAALQPAEAKETT